jgi:DNA-binding NtrC family response regulator
MCLRKYQPKMLSDLQSGGAMGAVRVAVVDADVGSGRELCALLEQARIAAQPLHSLEDLMGKLEQESIGVVVIDLDSLPVNNAFFRSLRKRRPDVAILCLSSRTHHPDLQEAMSTHIYASLTKPLNAEELLYWLKTVAEV